MGAHADAAHARAAYVSTAPQPSLWLMEIVILILILIEIATSSLAHGDQLTSGPCWSARTDARCASSQPARLVSDMTIDVATDVATEVIIAMVAGMVTGMATRGQPTANPPLHTRRTCAPRRP